VSQPQADPLAAVEAVRNAHPDLTYEGFRCRHLTNRNVPNAMTSAAAVREFVRASEFLTAAEPYRTKRPTKRTSYSWKHDAERWAGDYVSNGMFIAAALAHGHVVQPIADTPNARISLKLRAATLEGGRPDV